MWSIEETAPRLPCFQSAAIARRVKEFHGNFAPQFRLLSVCSSFGCEQHQPSCLIGLFRCFLAPKNPCITKQKQNEVPILSTGTLYTRSPSLAWYPSCPRLTYHPVRDIKQLCCHLGLQRQWSWPSLSSTQSTGRRMQSHRNNNSRLSHFSMSERGLQGP